MKAVVSVIFALLINSEVEFILGAQMQYPITIGGFDGDTEIEQFMFDQMGGLLISGYSNDSSMMVTTNSRFLAYLPPNSNSY